MADQALMFTIQNIFAAQVVGIILTNLLRLNPYIGNYPQEFQTCKHPSLSLGSTQWNRCRSQYRCFGSQTTIIRRRPDFSKISSEDVSYFKKILGERGVVQDEETLDAANTDWMRKYKGTSKLMLQPRSAEDVGISLSLPEALSPY